MQRRICGRWLRRSVVIEFSVRVETRWGGRVRWWVSYAWADAGDDGDGSGHGA